MRSPFPNVSDKQWKEHVEERRQFQFLAGAHWPSMWQRRARQHKRSADILYEVARTANERQMSRFVEQCRAGIATGSRIVEGEEREEMLDQDLISEYFLLIGYALECLFKGYLLAILPELVQNDVRIDGLIVTHDLAELCRDANMAISDEERELLVFLTQCIIWRSKYPVPLKLADTPSPIQETRDRPQIASNPYSLRLKDTVDDLCVRAGQRLEAERRRLNP